MATTHTPVYYPYFEHHYYTSGKFPNPVYTSKVSANRNVGNGSETVTGTSNKDWRLKIAKKLDASSYYYRSKLDASIRRTRGSCDELGITSDRKSYVYDSRYTGPIPRSWPETDAVVSDLALASLKRKIAKHEEHFNALLPLAELKDLRQTYRSSVDLAADFLQVVMDIRKTKGRSAAKHISKAWLTFGFGIAPVISDVAKLSDSILAHMTRTDHTAVLSGSSSKTWTSGGMTMNPTDTGTLMGTNMRIHQHIVHKLSYQYKGAFNFALASSTDYGAARQFGFKVDNLVPTAWALVPFSWLLDYFTTVGDCLDDTFIGTPVKHVYLNMMRRYEALGENYIHIEHRPVRACQGLQSNIGRCKYRYSVFERTPLNTLPHRVMRLKTTDEIGLHSLTKLLNLAAIIVK